MGFSHQHMIRYFDDRVESAEQRKTSNEGNFHFINGSYVNRQRFISLSDIANSELCFDAITRKDCLAGKAKRSSENMSFSFLIFVDVLANSLTRLLAVKRANLVFNSILIFRCHCQRLSSIPDPIKNCNVMCSLAEKKNKNCKR